MSTARRASYRLELLEGDEGGRGYVLVDAQDGQRLAWGTLSPGYGIQSAPVAGSSHRLEALQDAAFGLGKPVALVRERENEHDPSAIAVWDAKRRVQAGYVPQGAQGRRLAKRLDKGEDLRALVMWETRKGGERVAIRLLFLHEGMRAEITAT